MKTLSILISASLLLGTVALAHQGVKDPAVKARMQSMSAAGQASKTLGGMARGKIAFDAVQAAEAKAMLLQVSTEIPALFQENASDPLSEAAPAIWTDYADFTSKAGNLKNAVMALDTSNAANLGQGMRAVGGSCGGCHKAYRVKK